MFMKGANRMFNRTANVQYHKNVEHQKPYALRISASQPTGNERKIGKGFHFAFD